MLRKGACDIDKAAKKTRRRGKSLATRLPSAKDFVRASCGAGLKAGQLARLWKGNLQEGGWRGGYRDEKRAKKSRWMIRVWMPKLRPRPKAQEEREDNGKVGTRSADESTKTVSVIRVRTVPKWFCDKRELGAGD